MSLLTERMYNKTIRDSTFVLFAHFRNKKIECSTARVMSLEPLLRKSFPFVQDKLHKHDFKEQVQTAMVEFANEVIAEFKMKKKQKPAPKNEDRPVFPPFEKSFCAPPEHLHQPDLYEQRYPGRTSLLAF